MANFYDPEVRNPQFYRRSFAAPIALFGRGRVLSLIFMGTMALFSYVSKDSQSPVLTPDHLGDLRHMSLTVPARYAAATPSTHHQNAPSSYEQAAWQAPQFSTHPAEVTHDPITHHGGTIEDYRAASIRAVGAKLAQCITHVPETTLRFYILRDDRYPATYTLTDGSILMTAAAFDRCNTELALANVLSQRITDFVYQGYARDPYQVEQYAGHLLTVAGYAPAHSTSQPAANVAWQNAPVRK